ncbi:hypothetical protein [Phytopseudomonas punonensis]|uniref:Uncharacterized protein n=1 Tax=Phytopseudomonas punonensis TaxID=1220495 RepID=A0A1M7LLN4_9GAMM|nr:hypothetical protein [Pseudomonas punonensis]SHM78938.1 hypothetical protein SAMN05216288_4300 [Pseudomonas punonensis]
MTAPHLQHLAALIANDGHAASFHSLGQYRSALLKEIAQTSATPEQEPVAGDPPGSFTKHMEYMERCRQQQKTIDGMNAAHWEVVQKLEAATQRADAAERKLGEVVELLLLIKKQPGLNEIHRARINTLLSASAEPSGYSKIGDTRIKPDGSVSTLVDTGDGDIGTVTTGCPPIACVLDKKNGVIKSAEQPTQEELGEDARDLQARDDQERALFEREERYMVIKLSKLADDQGDDMDRQEQIYRLAHFGNAMVECVVVESDWPEYPAVWQMIEDRMKGKQPASVAVPDELRAEIMRADGVLAALTACTRPLERLERNHGADWSKAIDSIRRDLLNALAAHRAQAQGGVA